MPPLTPEQQAQLAAMLQFQDYGMPTMANYNSQLNLFQDIMQTMADPTFMYLQGLLTDQEVAAEVEGLLYDPIEISTANWRDDYNFAVESGNDIIAEGMQLIQQGFKVPSIIVKLKERFKDSFGDFSQFDEDAADLYREELEAFQEKYINAQDIEGKILSGEYIRDASGNVLKPVDKETGQKRLENFGFRGYQANPDSWRVMLNAPDVERAQKLAEESTRLTEERANKQKAGQKQSVTLAQSAYKEFLNKTPEGKKILEQVSKPRKTEKATEYPWNKPTPVGSLSAPLSTRISYGAGQLFKKLLPSGGVSLPFSGGLDEKVKEMKKAQNEDYWAKMAASYAGRAAQDEKRKELERLDAQATEKAEAAKQSMVQARASGTSSALDQMKLAPYFAAMIASQAQPETKKTYVKQAPRVLSDSEIETMANMIAGGMA
jgi:hypothetical protein